MNYHPITSPTLRLPEDESVSEASFRKLRRYVALLTTLHVTATVPQPAKVPVERMNDAG